MPQFRSSIDRLNPQQKAAVTTPDGPLLVIAGAGSGKTRVITHRIAWLVREHGVAPWEIFAATFTNKAAEEMRHRIQALLPGADVARLAISTFHSLCVGMLRREAHHLGLSSRFSICDDGDQMALIKDCLRQLDVPAAALRPEQVRNWIATAKIQMLDPDQAKRELPNDYGPACAKAYQMYQERLLTNDAVDFDDLILHVVKIFHAHPEVLEHYQDRWRYVLVDEYQDTNKVQFEFVRLLAAKHGNICVVGDEDQSIYSWRGAEVENLLQFPALFPGTQIIRLEQNYRSTENILHVASAVISHNTKRMGKDLWSERGEGEPITVFAGYSERDEAAKVVDTIAYLHKARGFKLNDIAIFYRVNALSRVFEDQLRQRGLTYRVIGGIKFYERAEVKDLLCYLRVAVNQNDGLALERIINRPARGIGEKTLLKLYAEVAEEKIPLWERLRRIVENDEPGLQKKARAGIGDLVSYVKQWRELAEDHPPHEVLERILRDTQYEESLSGDNELEIISRRENIAELVSAVEEFHAADPGLTLVDFLERVALVNAQDDIKDDQAVSLMTLHCAKGLEYPLVFLVAMEEPIFPSARAVNDQGHFEEERRLFYVGVTRAQDLLFLSRADSRTLYGRPNYNMPSLFLNEVPRELTRTLEEAKRYWGRDHAGGNRTEPNDVPNLSSRSGGRRGDRPAIQPAAMCDSAPAESAESEGLFAVGARVMHAKLGPGEVLGATGQGEKRKIKVKFDAGLEFEIMECFGGLEPAPDDDLPY